MNSRNSSLLCVALALLALSSAIEAFDITKMLAQYPDLSSFSKYLTETKLADQINSRKTVTVLAVDNSGISSISGKPTATIKAILGNHVILDYYNEMKLTSAVENEKTQLTTLQNTIKVSLIGDGEIAFGSAANGAPTDVELVKTVVSQPHSISILQVTRPIDGQSSSSASSPASSSTPKSQAPSEAPPPSKSSLAPESSPASEISPSPEEAKGPSDGDAPAEASGSSPQIQVGLVWAALMGFGALRVAM